MGFFLSQRAFDSSNVIFFLHLSASSHPHSHATAPGARLRARARRGAPAPELLRSVASPLRLRGRWALRTLHAGFADTEARRKALGGQGTHVILSLPVVTFRVQNRGGRASLAVSRWVDTGSSWLPRRPSPPRADFKSLCPMTVGQGISEPPAATGPALLSRGLVPFNLPPSKHDRFLGTGKSPAARGKQPSPRPAGALPRRGGPGCL